MSFGLGTVLLFGISSQLGSGLPKVYCAVQQAVLCAFTHKLAHEPLLLYSGFPHSTQDKMSGNKGKKSPEDVPRIRDEAPPEALAKPIPRGELPKDLQKLIDREDDFMDRLYEGRYAQTYFRKAVPVAYAEAPGTISSSTCTTEANPFQPIGLKILQTQTFDMQRTQLDSGQFF